MGTEVRAHGASGVRCAGQQPRDARLTHAGRVHERGAVIRTLLGFNLGVDWSRKSPSQPLNVDQAFNPGLVLHQAGVNRARAREELDWRVLTCGALSAGPVESLDFFPELGAFLSGQ